MNTLHKIINQSSNNLNDLDDNSVHLVITSPPYPMIQMWDDQFGQMNKEITVALENNDGNKAFELMHQELDYVWKSISRVLVDGGIACINIGDATRKIDDTFQLFNSYSRVVKKFIDLGFVNLPNIIWRKTTNSPTKFMGSGMYPPSAYITLEHEHILVFRKGSNRKFSKDKTLIRRESAYFWEERNKWFSDCWMDIKGTRQTVKNEDIMRRSAAYDIELVHRLVNMYSIKYDTVLDPYLGTGTTTIGAILNERNSVGYEIEKDFFKHTLDRIDQIPVNFYNNEIHHRIKEHLKFIDDRKKAGKEIKYENKNHKFEIVTGQEKELKLNLIKSIKKQENQFIVEYEQDKNK